MYDFEEACPISKAASVLCERWTLQILREMMLGAKRFSEFRQYLPKMSPTLLNTRLKALEKQGLIVKRKIPEKSGYEYRLSPSGKALGPLLSEFGKWGMQYAFTSMNEEQLNVSALIRDFAVALQVDQLPEGNSVIQFNVNVDNKCIIKYIIIRDGKQEICDENIGYDVDVNLTADLKTFGQIWFNALSISSAIKNSHLKIFGSSFYTNNITRWLGTSQFIAGKSMKKETNTCYSRRINQRTGRDY